MREGTGHVLWWYSAVEVKGESELLRVIHLAFGEVQPEVQLKVHRAGPEGKDKQVQPSVTVQAVEGVPVQ